MVVHRNSSALNGTAVSIVFFSSLILTSAAAQEGSTPPPSSSTPKIAMVAPRKSSASVSEMLLPDDPVAIPLRTPEVLSALAASECSTNLGADPTVAVQGLPDPIYVHTLSKSEISSLENEVSGQVREAAGLTLILAGAVQTHAGEARAPSGTSCVVFDGVKILPIKEITVYVASEYPVDGCNYNAARRHEEKHVAIARRVLSEYKPRLLRVVSELRLQSRGFPARVDDRSTSTGRTAADVQSAVQSVIDQLKAAIEKANRALDEADNGRTLGQCPSW